MKIVNPLILNSDTLKITQDQTIHFGNLCLSLSRGGQQWLLEFCYGSATSDSGWLSFGEGSRQRLVVDIKNPSLQLGLRLADRPIVSRPQEKLALSPGAHTTVYLHTTLWLCLYYNDALLVEIPANKLSDIWFGPNSREGQLAYTDTTPANLMWDENHSEDYKAATAITIKNNSREKLSLEKISVPVSELKLFRVGDQYLSDAIEITIDRNQEANLKINPVKSNGRKAILLSDARKTTNRSALTRAVNVLFA